MGFVVFIVCCHFISLYYLPREGPLLLLQAVQKALPRLILSFCKDNHFFRESVLFLLFFLFFRSHVCRIRFHVCRIRSHVCHIRSRVCRIRSHDSVVIFLFRMFVPHTLPVGVEALKNATSFKAFALTGRVANFLIPRALPWAVSFCPFRACCLRLLSC